MAGIRKIVNIQRINGRLVYDPVENNKRINQQHNSSEDLTLKLANTLINPNHTHNNNLSASRISVMDYHTPCFNKEVVFNEHNVENT